MSLSLFDDLNNGIFIEDEVDYKDEVPHSVVPRPFARLTNGQIKHRGQTYSSLPYEVYVSYQNMKSASTNAQKQFYKKQFADALKTYLPEDYMDFFGCTICNMELQTDMCNDAQVCPTCKNK